MDPTIFVKPPKIDPAVWRPDMPLVVMERSESKEQLCVWIAVRWLMAAFPHEKGFGTRKIARRAKVNQKYITRWCDELIGLGLMECVGKEQAPGFRNPRPVYTIPLRELERISNEMALDVLLRWGAPLLENEPPPESQMGLDFPLLDAVRGSSTDPLRDQSTDPLRDQSTDPLRDQSTDPLRDQSADPLRDQSADPLRDQQLILSGIVGRKEGRKEGGRESRARAKRQQIALESLPPDVVPPPPPPDDQPPLAEHPIDLWRDACPTYRRIDLKLLAGLVAEHNAPTGGHGLYWTGRAIQALAYAGPIHSVKAVKATLDRWRTTDSYGSDTPAYERRKAQNDERRSHTSDSAHHRHNGTGPRDRAEDRQRARSAAPRPGDPAYYERYRGRGAGAADDE